MPESGYIVTRIAQTTCQQKCSRFAAPHNTEPVRLCRHSTAGIPVAKDRWAPPELEACELLQDVLTVSRTTASEGTLLPTTT